MQKYIKINDNEQIILVSEKNSKKVYCKNGIISINDYDTKEINKEIIQIDMEDLKNFIIFKNMYQDLITTNTSLEKEINNLYNYLYTKAFNNKEINNNTKFYAVIDYYK